jgi:hypothetical protein
LQSGIKSADDLRVKEPINAMMAWLSGGLVTQLNDHFQSISATISTINSLGKHKQWIPASEMTPATVNGPAPGTFVGATVAQNIPTLAFDQATNEFAFFTWSAPSSWDGGPVTFVPVWTAASSSGSVVWAFDGTAYSDGDALDVAFGASGTSTDPLASIGTSNRGPESTPVTIAGTPQPNDLVNFRVRRNAVGANDTLSADASMIGVELFYTTNAAVDVA